MRVRELLKSDRVYFVRTDGSNANDGWEDNPRRAFKDWNHAVVVAGQLDLNGHTVTLQAGDESDPVIYKHNVILCPLNGGGTLQIRGNGSDRTAWESEQGDTWTLHSTGSVQVNFENGRLGSAANGIKINYNSVCNIGSGVEFGDFGGAGIWVHDNQAVCQILNSDISFRGKMQAFLLIQYGHCFLEGCKMTAFDDTQFKHGFITMYPRGSAQVIANSVDGNACGKRYALSYLSLLNLNGQAAETQLLGDENGLCDATSVVA